MSGIRGALALLLAACLSSTAQTDPAALRIAVVEGEGVAYAPGGRATRGVTVEVADERGNPLSGATVTFRLPTSGASGKFPGGSTSESVATGADGRANVWGVEWNHTPGQVEITVTAVKGPARAATVAHVTLSEAAVRPRISTGGGGGGHKFLWIALLAAGGAAGGIAASGMVGKSGTTAAAASPVNAPHIGTPTIIIGSHP